MKNALCGFMIGVTMSAMVYGLFLNPKSLQPRVSVAVPASGEVAPDLVIKYRRDGGAIYELVCDPIRAQVVLRQDILPEATSSVDQTEMLKAEVVRLASSREPVPLGNSGVSFLFSGGYPIWGLHEEVGPGYHKKCLYFSREAIIENGVIRAKGSETREGWYPYPDFEIKQTQSGRKYPASIGAWYAWARMGLNAQYVATHDVTKLGT